MVRVKICGITTPSDAAFAADCGADAIGLNFYPKSPRYLTPDRAEEIVRAMPPFSTLVGLFVGTPDDEVANTVRDFGLRAVQSYPERPPCRSYFPAAHVPAFRVRDAASLELITRYVREAREAGVAPAAVLVDAHVEGKLGGTGHVAPWHLLAGFDPGVPVVLAGGLTPDNVADAIRAVRPWGVDVASGVESAPGRKDPGRVRAFMQAVHAA